MNAYKWETVWQTRKWWKHTSFLPLAPTFPILPFTPSFTREWDVGKRGQNPCTVGIVINSFSASLFPAKNSKVSWRHKNKISNFYFQFGHLTRKTKSAKSCAPWSSKKKKCWHKYGYFQRSFWYVHYSRKDFDLSISQRERNIFLSFILILLKIWANHVSTRWIIRRSFPLLSTLHVSFPFPAKDHKTRSVSLSPRGRF